MKMMKPDESTRPMNGLAMRSAQIRAARVAAPSPLPLSPRSGVAQVQFIRRPVK